MYVFIVVLAVVISIMVIGGIFFAIVCYLRKNRSNEFDVAYANNESNVNTLTSNIATIDDAQDWHAQHESIQQPTTTSSKKVPRKPPRLLLPALIPDHTQENDTFDEVPLDTQEDSMKNQENSDYESVWMYKST